MKQIIRSGLVFLFLTCMIQPVNAQDTTMQEDFSTIESVINALYDVISGPAGIPRDSIRMASLFVPKARLIPIVPLKEGGSEPRVVSVPEFYGSIKKFTSQKGFFESEIGRTVEQFGNLAHVFSAYESRF